MAKTPIKSDVNEQNDTTSEASKKEKTCFAIMPIADHPDYTQGHFTRVYNHLIKPACEKAGYKVIRADDAKASHMIMFDILKNIVECDMAICDLSSKNANVFYELGLRQAFNKKTILITDSITNTPFDITGFRYVKYSESLRVDTVMSDVLEISAMLQETESAAEDDINSIVNLLKIQPAHINKVQLNEQESVLYELVKNLDSKVSKLYNNGRNSNYKTQAGTERWANSNSNIVYSNSLTGMPFMQMFKEFPEFLDMTTFSDGTHTIGKYVGNSDTGDFIFRSNKNEEFHISTKDIDRLKLRAL